MEQQKACNKCKHIYDTNCSRKQKVVGQTLNAYHGTYSVVFNIPYYKLPYCSAERKNRGIIKSFILGKTCGETAQFFESK